jgi:hypothetical protein
VVVAAGRRCHQEVGEEAMLWWCCGVVVVGERMCGGVHLVDVEKMYKKNLFFCVIFECGFYF